MAGQKNIHNISWRISVSLTRAEVQSLGKIAEFIGNIEKDYKKQFPSGLRDADWKHIRSAFHTFGRLKDVDKGFVDDLVELLEEEGRVIDG